jgi:hypothetical protein
VVIFFACLDLEQKSSFMDGHELKKWGDRVAFRKPYRPGSSRDGGRMLENGGIVKLLLTGIK